MKRLLGCGATVAALFLLALSSASASVAPSPAEVTEFPLGAGAFSPYEPVMGPDGDIRFALTSGIPGRSAMEQKFSFGIDRITPTGQVAAFPLTGKVGVRSMTGGPDGNVWFRTEEEVGSIDPAGQITTFPIRTGLNGGITAGAEGNLWLAQNSEPGVPAGAPTDRLSRMTTSGQVTAFPLASTSAGLSSIASDRAGNIWFTETFGNKIGRITPQGQIKEFPLPVAKSYPAGIVRGPEGNLWFTEGRGSGPALGRITPSGQITDFLLDEGRDEPGQLAAASDGRLWFVDGPALIGRITPSGRVTRIKLRNAEMALTGIAGGPEGVWYTAAGEPPAEGGGGTLMAHVYSNPGIIGRVVPGPLTARIATGSVKAAGQSAPVSLACGGGRASSVCRGRIRITVDSPKGTVTLARGRYALPVDLRRQVRPRLTKRGAELLSRQRRLRATVSVSLRGKGDRARRIVLHR